MGEKYTIVLNTVLKKIFKIVYSAKVTLSSGRQWNGRYTCTRNKRWDKKYDDLKWLTNNRSMYSTGVNCDDELCNSLKIGCKRPQASRQPLNGGRMYHNMYCIVKGFSTCIYSVAFDALFEMCMTVLKTLIFEKNGFKTYHRAVGWLTDRNGITCTCVVSDMYTCMMGVPTRMARYTLHTYMRWGG